MNDEFPQLLTTEELGKLLRVSKWTIYHWHRTGRYQAVRIGGRLMWPTSTVHEILAPKTK
jgi:excisionase family DNA binding protein